MHVPFVPSPLYVVDKMLELAGAGPQDILYDLGCGDGRIPIRAVKKFGVRRAYCVEIREDLAREAKTRVAREGLEDRIIVLNEDMFKVSIRGATLVTLFLLTSVNRQLAPLLEAQLRPGARIVSHEFRIPDWSPVVYATVNDGRISHDIYMYIIGLHRGTVREKEP